MSHCALTDKRCKPCEGGVDPMSQSEAQQQLAKLKGWTLSEDGKQLIKHYSFKGFYKTMGFVNAIAWIANQQQHHPDLRVGYNYCEVTFTTHAIDGLSENDFICAAHVDALEA